MEKIFEALDQLPGNIDPKNLDPVQVITRHMSENLRMLERQFDLLHQNTQQLQQPGGAAGGGAAAHASSAQQQPAPTTAAGGGAAASSSNPQLQQQQQVGGMERAIDLFSDQQAASVTTGLAGSRHVKDYEEVIVELFLNAHGRKGKWENKTGETLTLEEIVDHANKPDDPTKRGFFTRPIGTATREALAKIGVKNTTRGEIKAEDVLSDVADRLVQTKQESKK